MNTSHMDLAELKQHIDRLDGTPHKALQKALIRKYDEMVSNDQSPTQAIQRGPLLGIGTEERAGNATPTETKPSVVPVPGPGPTQRAPEPSRPPDPLVALHTWARANQGRFWRGRHPEIPTPEGGWLGRWEHDHPDWKYSAVLPDSLETFLRDRGYDPETVVKDWHTRGWLFTGGAKEKATKIEWIAGIKVEVYAIRREAFDQAEVIDLLAAVGNAKYGLGVGDYIRARADRWPDWLKEYHGLMEWMLEERPMQKRLASSLAARMVAAWVVHRDLERMPYDRYGLELDNAWAELRRT